MKIYEMRIAPNPRRVRIFLAEKGITDIEFIEIDLQKGENLNSEFKQKNPLAKVPVLELDNGQTISESVAICRYFEELYPEKPLMGETAFEKAQIEMWQRWAEFYFLMPTGMCFQHSSGYFKDRMNPIKEWGAECATHVRKFMTHLNKHLEHNTFLAGDTFSIADITALCTMDFNRVNQISIDKEQVHLLRWYKEVSSRPSAKA
ncbi:glutathione S-transferase [Oleiphilus sp. HI0081]|uniref:glutathione S-transferase family protein n=3 Tax=Oleiphilus TaxID=141450 RepID=UPI0007C39192|nr:MULTISPECIES: glutathione S-transferase family protein [unclassified Oleiphilus]KZY47824.1 glutathione S-transferase [Oleiphilus sp. HI0050]KZY87007.1 glutathione S-transferase [Oleiphilus sp. HI0072]KZZ11616.1 glutathione S-transferase [Oleiphilus sp. HI0078]KZZ28508.1 glutathione S-transferase [Oleiphilus sp. HI0081]KZY28251.1 glutathione S-transferase [Oleiphilus sp. HI0043]